MSPKCMLKLGELLFGIGIFGLFISIVNHLTNTIPTNIKYGGIDYSLVWWVIISTVLVILGFFLQGKKFTKEIFTNHIKGYFSQIIATLATALIVIILITDTKYKLSYTIGILFISFILHVLSEEVKK